MAKESSFDAIKDYYVFKYVVDPVSAEPTEYEGEIQAFVKAADPWEAVSKAGFEDMNAYGANRIDDLKKFEEAIATERKHLTKISKQLKEMTDERDAAHKKFLEERECPNGCGKMDSKWRCDKCGFGREAEEIIKELDKAIKEAKKAGEDTSGMEEMKKQLQATLD